MRKEHCIQQIKKQLMLEGDHISNIFEATKKLEEIKMIINKLEE